MRKHTERLKKLARILGEHKQSRSPKKGTKFNMQTWGTHDGEHHPKEQNFCGTSACALGHAALDKGFQRAGLRMEWEFLDAFTDVWGNRKPAKWRADILTQDADGFHVEGVSAGAVFFGLTHYEAEYLFGGILVRKSDVIKEIQRLATDRHELTVARGQSCECTWCRSWSVV